MAVKQHLTDIESEKNTLDISVVLNKLELLNTNNEPFPTGQNLVRMCDHIVSLLARVDFPRDAGVLKVFKEDVLKVGKLLTEICEQKCHDYDVIVTSCLKALYRKITSQEEPSGAASIVLQLFDETIIPRAVCWILKNSDNPSNESIKRGFSVLCGWLRYCSFTPSLNLWIIGILNGLRDQQKYDLLLEMACNEIEYLFLSLIIPFIRPKVAPVILCILSSIRHTPIVFHKIIGRVPRVLLQLRREEITTIQDQKLIQNIVDTISALIYNFPSYDDLYKETELVLRQFTPSFDYRSTLNVPPWSDTSHNSISHTNARVGLVNLGNTCYMNSVLQALVMTKQFSREILLTNYKAPLLLKIQELLALLLHSARPELKPRDVLIAARPPGFQPGHQQDSSEFLGYLLERLHDEEKNVLTNGKIKHNGTVVEWKGDSDDEFEMMKSWQTEDDLIKIREQHELSSGDCNMLDETTTMTTATSIKQLDTEIIENGCYIKRNNDRKILNNKKTTTLIQNTFGGKILITYKCINCGSLSKNVDTFRDLPLSFPDNNIIITDLDDNNIDDGIGIKTINKIDKKKTNYSVQELLNYNLLSEKLNGDNQYSCEKCKQLCDGERHINLIKSPKNLILTLKHFKYDQRYHMREKLTHKVYHNELITIKMDIIDKYNNNNNNINNNNNNNNINNNRKYNIKRKLLNVNYVLYAAVIHAGTNMDSGHYYTFASDNNGIWYKFNDDYVTISSINELHNLSPPNTPYILFYQKLNTDELLTTISKNNNNLCKENINDDDEDDDDDDFLNTDISDDEDNILLNDNDNDDDDDDSIKLCKKPCLTTGNITTKTGTTNINDNNKLLEKLPEFNDLPIHIKELITNDNIIYNDELKINKKKQQDNKNRPILGRKNNYDSNNDDPPNSCGGGGGGGGLGGGGGGGGNTNDYRNQFIY